MDRIDAMFERWLGYSDFECFPQVTLEIGLAIYAEMERCEPFQHTKSIYDDDYKRFQFIRAVHAEACSCYPMMMERAKIKYFQLHTVESVAKEIAEGLEAGSVVLDEETKHKVLCQPWEESERGWGCRPDGYSLHVDKDAHTAFIEAYWKAQPDRDPQGHPPDEYSRPSGNPYVIDVPNSVYEEIKANKHGVRKYDRCPSRR